MKIALLAILSFLTIGFFLPGTSYAVGGGIDPVHKFAWSENYGWINFGSTGNVFVDDDKLTGYAWSEQSGWINLNPNSTDYVRHDGKGNLSGHAWGEGVGYIDFSGVTIDSEGYFHGYAYSPEAGRISFNCLNTNTCSNSNFKVKTYWTVATNINSGSGSGGGGGGGGSSSGRGGTTRPRTATTTASSSQTEGPVGHICAPYLTEYIKYGGENNPAEVMKLERFLNEKEGNNLPIDGIYSPSDLEAVKRFQEKYRSQVLDIWGLNMPTGYVYRTTVMKINSFYCQAELQCPVFTEYNRMTENNNSEEVKKTKGLLADLGFYTLEVNTVFDLSLHNALKNFQETFRATMLDPWRITEGTGYKYKTTNKFLNMLMGCATPAVMLEGVGMFDY